MPGIIKLLDKNGEVVQQAIYRQASERTQFKTRCEKMYAKRVFKNCKFKDEPDEKLAREKKNKKPGVNYGSIVGGGSKTTQIRASRYL